VKHEPSPSTYMRGARDFHVAASHLLNHPSDTPLPALFLLSRSIELSLKSLLLVAGISAANLARKPFRHNLESLLKKTIEIEVVATEFTPEQLAAIGLLSKEYDSNGLGYIEENRTYLLPLIDLIEEAAASLLESARRSCTHSR
jgi:hypothetical protein